MSFIKYPKIHRLGKEEVDGILDGQCFIQEKLDGANTSIWMEDGKICCGSRNQRLSSDVDNHGGKKTFNGFINYVKQHPGIRKLLEENPEYRLYGEWLVRHSIPYNETAYRKWYMFDILYGANVFLTVDELYSIAHHYEIETPQLFGLIENPTMEQLQEFCGKSSLADVGEGIVIKNFGFVDMFVNTSYAKLVTEKFKEANAVTFGGNNKHSESYWEMYIVNKYVTLGRVQKVMNKIQPEIDEKLDLKHIPRIANTVYHDLLTEEIWDIQKKVHTVTFKKLQRLAMLKTKQIYIDILNEDISIADKTDG